MIDNIKVAICAIAKNENRYVCEWTNYHLNLGFDKIFIYDNNDVCSEKISDVLNNDKVTIIEVFGEKYVQNKCYTECFNKNKNNYDWILFIDIDEFVVIENQKRVKEFLVQDIFSDAQIIRLNWKHFDDSNFLDVVNDDYNVFNRFKHKTTYKKDVFGKSFVKCNTNFDLKIVAHGCYNENLKAVNAIGELCLNNDCKVSNKPLYKGAWINHYRTKTIGEYIRQKYFRGDASSSKYENKYSNLDFFFETNKRTKEKEEYGMKLINELQKTH